MIYSIANNITASFNSKCKFTCIKTHYFLISLLSAEHDMYILATIKLQLPGK